MKTNILPDKYCPACGSVWIPYGAVGDVPTCQCSCVPGACTIRYDPVPKARLQVLPVITEMAKKYYPTDDN